MSARLIKIAIIACVLFTGLTAHASPIKIDPIDPPNGPFHFVFVTSGTTTPDSDDIGYYNTFVQNAADNADIGVQLGLTWRAIISTPFVDAIDNVTDTNYPIYTLDGNLVASGAADLWDGSIDAAIDYTESGTILPGNAWAWTGSLADGHAYAYAEVGGATFITAAGLVANTDDGWIQEVTLSDYETHHIYAIASEPVVLTAYLSTVPLPPSLLLMASGMIGCIGFRRWRRR